jgi:hypothetical protein
MKLFFGEYEPANRELSIGNARVAFLNAVRLHAPEVLKELSDYPFELYKSIGAPLVQWWQIKYGRCHEAYSAEVSARRLRGTQRRVLFRKRRDPSQPVEAFTPGERVAELRESLLEWATAWRLEPEWCLEHALRTMYDWNQSPHDLEELMWQQGGGGWVAPTKEDERRFVFEHPGWEPTYDHRKKIKEEITLAFKNRLEEYLDSIEALVSERGFVKTKSKNEREHFEWLACFQVKVMSYEEIRDAFRPTADSGQQTYLSDDTKAVRKAVNELARFIGLPLRDDGCRPGRRSKATQTNQ